MLALLGSWWLPGAGRAALASESMAALPNGGLGGAGPCRVGGGWGWLVLALAGLAGAGLALEGLGGARLELAGLGDARLDLAGLGAGLGCTVALAWA